MYRADAAVYGTLLDHLRSCVLASAATLPEDKPRSPAGMTSAQMHELHSMAGKLEGRMAEIFRQNRFGESFSGQRIELASRVAHLISRHIGLVQLVCSMLCPFVEKD